jgi:ABC-2 type transport system permease protein
MNFSWKRALIIARREYLTSVRKKAFLITLVGMPAYFAFVMWISVKPQIDDAVKSIRELHTLGVVDSSGLFAGAPDAITTSFSAEVNPFAPGSAPPSSQTFRAQVRRFGGLAEAEAALRSNAVDQVLVVPPGFLATGTLRRYSHAGGGLATSAGERPIANWLVRGMLGDSVDPRRVERVARPTRGLVEYELGRDGVMSLKDDRRQAMGFLLPFMFGMLMSISIVTGGQYLLQGVSEEKESRILESLICTVSAEDLLVGKLVGLGSVGLTLVGAWAAGGMALSAPAAMLAQAPISPLLLALMAAFFVLGYLFYASLMTAIGALTSNMREAQQVAWAFTFANFVPFILMMQIIAHPDGVMPTVLSFIPFTAASTTVMRLAIPGAAVPAWQVAGSLGVLVISVWFVLGVAAKLFRIGLLMYGKTPTLPEVIKWARSK